MDILPPEATERIARIGFLARGRMAGPITGRHASPNRGASVEFAEHRPYSPGDSPRDLDWRVLGKANRYYIKQYIEETNLRATLLVDASGSMGYRGEAAAEGLSKFDYACRIAAALAYLFVKQQDAAGLVTFDTAVRNYLPPKTRNSPPPSTTSPNASRNAASSSSSAICSTTPRTFSTACNTSPTANTKSSSSMSWPTRNAISRSRSFTASATSKASTTR